MSVTGAVLLVVVVVVLGLAVVGWRHRQTPGSRLFAGLQAVTAVWVSTAAVGLVLDTGPLRLRLWGVTTGLSLLAGVVWLAFVLRYTGREWWLRPGPFGVVTAPLLAGAVSYALAPSWPLLVEETTQQTVAAGTVVTASIGPLGGALGVYLYAVFLGGFAVVLKTVADGETLFLGQSMALVLGSLVSVLAGAAQILGVAPVEGYPLIEVAVGGQSLFFAYAVFRQEVLAMVPAIARIGERTVFDELDDGILVVADDDTILRANARARSYLDADELVGRSVRPVLDGFGVETVGDLPTRDRREGQTFQVTASAVTGPGARPVGHALVLRDVTRLDRRQQRLQVLNRILRHNVRNSMTVAFGAADEIAERTNGEVASLAATVATQAERLTDISEKAIQIERVFDQSSYRDSVVVADVVDAVVARFESPDPTVVALGDGRTELTTNRDLLDLVLGEVVENALQHAGPDPGVRITGERSGDRYRLSVHDDGPGIHPDELEPIRDGEETALKHASGLGLWLTYWGVWTLGGDVDVDTSPDGTTVALTLPVDDAAGGGVR
ncbi:ATP-binding protein [Halomicroarcula sp. F13]|uniref:histidine kinase n=1 Tax=Haloarcula rubra TaxID=2487747 RepID=A0AAW4PN83_9EURY|nr:histidine kinase N-terminal 7TM domain-containing protein [Halomicroarcula rubra]MBX0321802.1 ATP-binding protein [Halomicroarcula rubra]